MNILQKVGNEFEINTSKTNNQLYPSSAVLENNKFIVTWDSDHLQDSNYEIHGQIFNNDGSKYNSEFMINTITSKSQIIPDVSNLKN